MMIAIGFSKVLLQQVKQISSSTCMYAALVLASWFCVGEVLAAQQDMSVFSLSAVESTSDYGSQLLAQSSRSRRKQALSKKKNSSSISSNSRRSGSKEDDKAEKSSRRRVLTSEKRVSVKKGGGLTNTNIDFDETDITGQRRTPNIGFVKSTVGQSGREFIKIRKEWHDAMVQSTLLVD